MRYRVTNPEAPHMVTDPDVAAVAEQVARLATERSPRVTGTLAAGYRVMKLGPSRYEVVNDVPYARFVEYGTHDRPAEPAFGQAIAVARHAAGGA
jgi:hypothetical protein